MKLSQISIAFTSLFAATLLLFSSGCKEKCAEVAELSEDGIWIPESPYCNYVRSESIFGASYVLPIGEEPEGTKYEYTATNGFTIVSQAGNDVVLRAPESGVGTICLTVVKDCDEPSNTVCMDVEAIDTDLIFYAIDPEGEPNRENNEFLAHGAGFAYEGFGYNVGGYSNNGLASSLSIQKFDPAFDAESWTKVGETPNGTDFTVATAVVENGTAYIFGVTRVWHLNLSDFSFTEGPTYPGNETQGVSFATMHDGKVYLVTRRYPTDPDHPFYTYTPSTMQFSTLPDLPHASSPGNFCASINGKLLFGGGAFGGSGVSWTVQPYYWFDPVNDTYTMSNANTDGGNVEENIPLTNFRVNDTLYLLTGNTLHYYDEAMDDFIKIDNDHPDWPTCFAPRLGYRARPRSVSSIVLGDKVVLAGYAESEGGASVNRTRILKLN